VGNGTHWRILCQYTLSKQESYLRFSGEARKLSSNQEQTQENNEEQE
jgi:hypothetical protein